jgi:hypothetical protein
MTVLAQQSGISFERSPGRFRSGPWPRSDRAVQPAFDRPQQQARFDPVERHFARELELWAGCPRAVALNELDRGAVIAPHEPGATGPAQWFLVQRTDQLIDQGTEKHGFCRFEKLYCWAHCIPARQFADAATGFFVDEQVTFHNAAPIPFRRHFLAGSARRLRCLIPKAISFASFNGCSPLVL